MRINRSHCDQLGPWDNFNMAQLQVPKEYVRRQLQSMGIQEISEGDLESYTKDFSLLIQEQLHREDSAEPSSDNSSLGGTPHSLPTSGTHMSSQAAHFHSSGIAGQPHPSLMTPNMPPTHTAPPGSAIFKTFPGDKENRVQFLLPSATPSPVQVMTPRKDHGSPRGGGGSEGHTLQGGRGRERGHPRRKVLRKRNGESLIFDESISDWGSEAGSPGIATGVATQLSDLSLTSVTSVDSEHSTSRLPEQESHAPKQHHKSFIRPSTTHPHLRGIKKCDPVSRYHEFRQIWDSHKPPGEKSRNGLRWHIREQLLHQDLPQYEPSRRTHKVNNFIVPTEKKRLALRWDIRNQLAHQ